MMLGEEVELEIAIVVLEQLKWSVTTQNACEFVPSHILLK